MRLITVLQLFVTVAVPILVLAALVVIAVQLVLLRRDLARRAADGVEPGGGGEGHGEGGASDAPGPERPLS